MLDWLLKEKQITQHVSVLDRSNREGGTCERADCPGQHASTTDVCDWHSQADMMVVLSDV
jgi:hypothetical protein